MPTSCSAPGCTQRYMKGAGIGFYRFPKQKAKKELWQRALKRVCVEDENKLWEPSDHDHSCSRHFVTGVPSKDSTHPDYVPSVFSFTPVNKITPNKVERFNRLKRRQLAPTPINKNATANGDDLDSTAQALLDLRSDLPTHLDKGTDPDPDPLIKKVEQLTLENSQLSMECQLLQNENRQLKDQLKQDKFTYTNLDNSRISHFTGLSSVAVFRWILVIVGLGFKSVGKLCAGDMLLMVLMKLRHNMTNKDLALRFHICPTQVSQILNQCLPVLARKLKFLIKWPCKSTILKNMQKSFRRNYN